LISRRKLLSTGAALAGTMLLLPVSIRAPYAQQSLSADSDIEQFYRLSLFLTDRTSLSKNVSLRALTMLTEEDKNFPEQVTLLNQKIKQAGLTSVDQLPDSPIFQDEKLRQICLSIISAWYLGYTGTPVEHRAMDNTRFVTYTGALMYEPTIDATVIPTYSRGKTNYWTQPPTTIKND
jgi:hypothetical protein